VGLFRRQKDLLSKQREELGLDRPFESPRPTSGGVPADPPSADPSEILGSDDGPRIGFPGLEGAGFDPRHSHAGGFTISSEPPATGWRRLVTIPRVFFITLAAVWWALHRLGLASSAALIAAFTVAVAAAARLGRSRVRIQTTRGPRSAPWQDPAERPPDPGEQPPA
jgi:hypothetical protein